MVESWVLVIDGQASPASFFGASLGAERNWNTTPQVHLPRPSSKETPQSTSLHITCLCPALLVHDDAVSGAQLKLKCTVTVITAPAQPGWWEFLH